MRALSMLGGVEGGLVKSIGGAAIEARVFEEALRARVE